MFILPGFQPTPNRASSVHNPVPSQPKDFILPGFYPISYQLVASSFPSPKKASSYQDSFPSPRLNPSRVQLPLTH
eukprot:1156499-Pelagomonas_calceolata.AAC.5